jgi:hypothetical protein
MVNQIDRPTGKCDINLMHQEIHNGTAFSLFPGNTFDYAPLLSPESSLSGFTHKEGLPPCPIYLRKAY